jgi:hypothetical protein
VSNEKDAVQLAGRMQRLIVEALASQPKELESGHGLRRLLPSPASLLACGLIVLASEVVGVVVGVILRQLKPSGR